LPISAAGGVKIWKKSSFSYSYRMERAVAKMRVSQMLQEVEPLVKKYVPAPFSEPGARTFQEYVADLDKSLDGKDANSGTHDIGDTLFTLTLTTPPAYVEAWSKAPEDSEDPLYMKLSRNLQVRLKELVTFYFFSDPQRYQDLASAAAPILFSCLPPSTSIKVNSDNAVERFNTDKDLHWDQSNMDQIRAMAGAPQTIAALVARLTSIQATLSGIPELAGTSSFYKPDKIGLQNLINAALKRNSATSPTPEFLGGLLFLESQLIEHAVQTGVEMARFRKSATTKPADALAHLAKFGEDLTSTFNQVFGKNPFMSGASRPLGTLLFMEAAEVLDPSLAGAPLAALMDITVIKSGKLSIDDMLAGKITPELVLHEQPFVQG
jgi:hypothetical protein